jgi:hypothetical protein
MDVKNWANISSNAALTDALFTRTGRKSITDIGNELLTGKISSNNANTQTIKDNYSKNIVDKEEAVEISNFASSLSAVDLALKSTGNKTAMDGLRQVAKHYAKDTSGFDEFMVSIKKMDDATLLKTFSTADKIADKGLDSGKFIDNIASAPNATQSKNIVDTTDKILSDKTAISSDIKNVYNKLMSNVKSIENSSLSQTEKNTQLTNFFTAILKGNTASEISAAIDKFNEK